MTRIRDVRAAFSRFGGDCSLRGSEDVARVVAAVQRAASQEHAIGPMIVCRRCKGSLEVEGEPCARCVVDGVPTGVDPASYDGCVCGEEHAGAVIDIGEHPSFTPGSSS